MHLAIELPEDIARQLTSAWGDMSRRSLEAVALEGYRSGALSRGQVGRLLGFNFWETEAFLKAKQAYLPYSESDLANDRARLDAALSA
jgi:predicted HTH domain antitoxin